MSRSDDPIPGIFNYCDRWCERCTLSARCSLFAFERDLETRKARSEDDARAFWEALNTVLRREDEEWVSDVADDEPWKDDEPWEDDEAPEFETGATWIDAQDMAAANAIEHALVRSADAYRRAVERWHEQFQRLAAGRSSARPVGLEVADALEVTRWYRSLIPMKLVRAVAPDGDDVDTLIAMNTDDDWDQGDANGSAKVALLGIERSFAAWSVLRDALPEAATATLTLMQRCNRLRLMLDREFPAARVFKRPGFDQE